VLKFCNVTADPFVVLVGHPPLDSPPGQSQNDPPQGGKFKATDRQISLDTSIDRFARQATRIQAQMQALLAEFDPAASTGTTIQRVTQFLSLEDDPAFSQSLGEANLQMRTNVALMILRLGIPGPYVPSPWTIELDPVQPSTSQLSDGVENMFIAANLISAQTGPLVVVDQTNALTALFTGTESVFNQINTGVVPGVAGQIGLFRTAMGATAGPSYPGIAATDQLADLLAFATSNKL